MRSNREGKQCRWPITVHSELHYPHRHHEDEFNSKSERCLMSGLRNVIEKLYSLSPRNRNYRSVPDYFQDILNAANGIDLEFRKLEHIFSLKKDNSCFHSCMKTPKYAKKDIDHLPLAAKSLLKVINNLKQDLIFTEHYTSVEGRQSLLQTRILINGLENKLLGLLKSVEELKGKLPEEYSNVGCSIGLDNDKLLSTSYAKKSQYESQNLNIPKKQRFNHILGRNPINNVLNMTHSNKHYCCAPACFQEDYREEKQRNKIHFENLQRTFHHESSNHVQISGKTNCFQTHNYCLSKDFPESKSQYNRYNNMTVRDHVSQTSVKKALKRDKRLEITTELQSELELCDFNNLPHNAEFKDKHYNKPQKSKTFTPQRIYMSDEEGSKKKVRRRRRKRTRAGKDHVRKYRSHSDKKRIGEHDITPKKKYSTNKYRSDDTNPSSRTKYDSDQMSFSGSDNDMQITLDTRKTKKASRTQSQPQNYRKRRRKKYLSSRTRRRHISRPNRSGLFSDNYYADRNRSAFGVYKSNPRYRKIKRMQPKKKRRSKIRRNPSNYTYSSVPYKRRRKIGGNRKCREARTPFVGGTRSDITHRYETGKERSFHSNITRMTLSDDCVSEYCIRNSFNPLECDRNCYRSSMCERNVYEITPQSCPSYCSYPCCVVKNNYNYQPIPYPMCSNSCFNEVNLLRTKPAAPSVQSERFFIEFEQPRKKKIVKTYKKPEKKVHYRMVSKSDSFLKADNCDSQCFCERYSESEESIHSQTKPTKIIYYKPPICPTIESKYVKLGEFYRESSERVYECETSKTPVMKLSRSTSTGRVSSFDRRTSTSELIKVVKAVGTSKRVSVKNKGTKTIPIKEPPMIETQSRYTNTEKIRNRTIGTDVIPIFEKPKARLISKATDPLYVNKENKDTNTVPEKKKNVKEIGTNTKPEQRKGVVHKGTNTLAQNTKSKAINTIPLKEKHLPQPITISKGTQSKHILTESKRTSYDKVKTRDKSTDTVQKRMLDKGQQFTPIISTRVAKMEEQDLWQKEVLTKEPSDRLHILTKQQVEYPHAIHREPVRQIQSLPKQPVQITKVIKNEAVHYPQVQSKPQETQAQLVTKEHVDHGTILTKKPIEHGQQVLTKHPVEHDQYLTKQTEEHVQFVTKQPIGHRQILTKEVEEQMQTLTTIPPKEGKTVTNVPMKHAQTLTPIPSDHCQLVTKISSHQGLVVIRTPIGQSQFITKNTTDHGQLLSKESERHIQALRQIPEYQRQLITRKPIAHAQVQTKEINKHEQLLTKEPFEQRQFMTKEQMDRTQLLTKELEPHEQALRQIPEYQRQLITRKPMAHAQVQTKERDKYEQLLAKEPFEQRQFMTKEKMDRTQHLTKELEPHDQVLRQVPEYQRQLITRKPMAQAQVQSKEIAKYEQLLTNKPFDQSQFITQNPIDHGQLLTKEIEGQRQAHTTLPQKQRKILTQCPQKHTKQILTKIPSGNCQLITKICTDQGQFIMREPIDQRQVITKKPKHHVYKEWSASNERIRGAREDLPVEQRQVLKKKPYNRQKIITKEPITRTQKLTKEPITHTQRLTKEPITHTQRLTKEPGKYLHSERKQHLHCRKNLTAQKPEFTGIYQGKTPEENIQISSRKITKESSSDMSIHLTIEKCQEELFRKRCRFCKCVKKCKCKCCNGRSINKEKVIVCEKKKSNIIRITNRPDCKVNLIEGEEIISDVDVDFNFNMPSSRSEICLTNNNVKVGGIRDTRSGFCDVTAGQNYDPNENKFHSPYCPDPCSKFIYCSNKDQCSFDSATKSETTSIIDNYCWKDVADKIKGDCIEQ